MEKFFPGKKLNKAVRAAKLLHQLTRKTVYVNEDFEEPWGFFISTAPPIHRGCLYCTIGGIKHEHQHGRKESGSR